MYVQDGALIDVKRKIREAVEIILEKNPLARGDRSTLPVDLIRSIEKSQMSVGALDWFGFVFCFLTTCNDLDLRVDHSFL